MQLRAVRKHEFYDWAVQPLKTLRRINELHNELKRTNYILVFAGFSARVITLEMYEVKKDD